MRKISRGNHIYIKIKYLFIIIIVNVSDIIIIYFNHGIKIKTYSLIFILNPS